MRLFDSSFPALFTFDYQRAAVSKAVEAARANHRFGRRMDYYAKSKQRANGPFQEYLGALTQQNLPSRTAADANIEKICKLERQSFQSSTG
jgi:hypothetical protein